MIMKKGLKIALMIVLGFLAVGVFTYATMWLWNWLVPELFKGPVISYWQALGLLALSKILFSGLGGKGGGGGGRAKAYWRERLRAMSPEEREQFKAKMKDKWCRWEEKAQKPDPPAGAIG